jgi:hypothetical protein
MEWRLDLTVWVEWLLLLSVHILVHCQPIVFQFTCEVGDWVFVGLALVEIPRGRRQPNSSDRSIR